MLETIYLAIIAALPALASIIGIISAVIKCVKDSKIINDNLGEKFEALATEIHDSKEMDELKSLCYAMLESNRKLAKQNDELLTELTKVRHETEV